MTLYRPNRKSLDYSDAVMPQSDWASSRRLELQVSVTDRLGTANGAPLAIVVMPPLIAIRTSE